LIEINKKPTVGSRKAMALYLGEDDIRPIDVIRTAATKRARKSASGAAVPMISGKIGF
jgi:hypothetical protein